MNEALRRSVERSPLMALVMGLAMGGGGSTLLTNFIGAPAETVKAVQELRVEVTSLRLQIETHRESDITRVRALENWREKAEVRFRFLERHHP